MNTLTNCFIWSICNSFTTVEYMTALLEYFNLSTFKIYLTALLEYLNHWIMTVYICDLVWQKGTYRPLTSAEIRRFLECFSSPMKAAMRIRFSHYLNKLLTFNIIQNTRNHQQSFPPFWIVFFLIEVHCSSIVSGEPLHVWRWGRWEGKGIL